MLIWSNKTKESYMVQETRALSQGSHNGNFGHCLMNGSYPKYGATFGEVFCHFNQSQIKHQLKTKPSLAQRLEAEGELQALLC